MGLGLENPVHILILLVVVLLLFGAKRLPDMGRGLGSGMREFRESLTSHQTEPQPTSEAQLVSQTQTPTDTGR
jgi:sec-independent protein translocase protein TatA